MLLILTFIRITIFVKNNSHTFGIIIKRHNKEKQEKDTTKRNKKRTQEKDTRKGHNKKRADEHAEKNKR